MTWELRLPYTTFTPDPRLVIMVTATSEMKPASNAYSIRSWPLSSLTKLLKSLVPQQNLWVIEPIGGWLGREDALWKLVENA